MRYFSILLVLAACALAFAFDASVREAIEPLRAKPVRNVAGMISKVGDWPMLAAACAIALVASAQIASAKRWTRILLAMLVASSIAGLTSNLVKSVTGRTRPNNKTVEQGWYGLKHNGDWLVGKNKFNSFPSSHTACAFAFFGILFAAGAAAGMIGMACATAIGASRIFLGAHHFSDVLFAAALGAGIAWWTWRGPLPLGAWAERIGKFVAMRRNAPPVGGSNS